MARAKRDARDNITFLVIFKISYFLRVKQFFQ
jgi:hypothetical protein